MNGLSQEDKIFFKNIFDQVNDVQEPKGPHYIENTNNKNKRIRNFET
jgi:hypothetical protein